MECSCGSWAQNGWPSVIDGFRFSWTLWQKRRCTIQMYMHILYSMSVRLYLKNTVRTISLLQAFWMVYCVLFFSVANVTFLLNEKLFNSVRICRTFKLVSNGVQCSYVKEWGLPALWFVWASYQVRIRFPPTPFVWPGVFFAPGIEWAISGDFSTSQTVHLLSLLAELVFPICLPYFYPYPVRPWGKPGFLFLLLGCLEYTEFRSPHFMVFYQNRILIHYYTQEM